MTHRAITITRSANLRTEFGDDLARKWFGDEAIDALPEITRGKNKGRRKGSIEWTKIERGGWVSTGPSYHGSPTGHVENRVGRIVDHKLFDERGEVIACGTLEERQRAEAERRLNIIRMYQREYTDAIRRADMIEERLLRGTSNDGEPFTDETREFLHEILAEKRGEAAIVLGSLRKVS